MLPLKVFIFASHLFKNRIPTKDNLVQRGIVQPNLSACVTGCGHAESIDHLFLWCHIFGSLCSLVKWWMYILFVTPFHFSDHVLYFSFLCVYSKI